MYDNVGSALFEVISQLPEYGLTRADERLLERHAESIVRHIPGKVTVAELGSGSGKKFAAFSKRWAAAGGSGIVLSKSLRPLWPCASASWATWISSVS